MHGWYKINIFKFCWDTITSYWYCKYLHEYINKYYQGKQTEPFKIKYHKLLSIIIDSLLLLKKKKTGQKYT